MKLLGLHVTSGRYIESLRDRIAVCQETLAFERKARSSERASHAARIDALCRQRDDAISDKLLALSKVPKRKPAAKQPAVKVKAKPKAT